MSRIGRLPITLPANVTVAVEGDVVTVNGPKGTLTQQIDRRIAINVENNIVSLTRANESNEMKAKHGLYRALLANMVKGVNEGFEKRLTFNGVGYKVQKNGDKLVLNIGLSHSVTVAEEAGVSLNVKDNEIIVSGINKDAVGEMAAKIRAIKPVEPYHIYGIRYSDEVVIKKAGKAAKK